MLRAQRPVARQYASGFSGGHGLAMRVWWCRNAGEAGRAADQSVASLVRESMAMDARHAAAFALLVSGVSCGGPRTVVEDRGPALASDVATSGVSSFVWLSDGAVS